MPLKNKRENCNGFFYMGRSCHKLERERERERERGEAHECKCVSLAHYQERLRSTTDPTDPTEGSRGQQI